MHIIPLKKRFKIYWKKSTFCNICLSQSSEPVIKITTCAREDILKSWCRLIVLYTPFLTNYLQPRDVDIPCYKNTSYLKTRTMIKNCRNSWHIRQAWALIYFLTLFRYLFVVHSTSIYRICVKSSPRQVSNKRSCTKKLYSYFDDHRLLCNCLWWLFRNC